MILPFDQAKAEAQSARDRLLGTVQEIQSRIEPANLLHDAVSDVKERSAKLAQAASDTVKERPATVAAVAAATIALLAHKPLWKLGRKIIGRPSETDDDDAS